MVMRTEKIHKKFQRLNGEKLMVDLPGVRIKNEETSVREIMKKLCIWPG